MRKIAAVVSVSIVVVIILLVYYNQSGNGIPTKTLRQEPLQDPTVPPSPQQEPVSNNPKNQPGASTTPQPGTSTTQRTTRQPRKPDVIDGPEGLAIVSQMPIESLAKYAAEVEVDHDYTVYFRPGVKILKGSTDAHPLKSKEPVTLNQMLSAEYVSLVKSAMSNSQSNPFNVPVGTLIRILRVKERKAIDLLKDEDSEVSEFYWDCVRTVWIYKYLNGHFNHLSQDLSLKRELLLHALAKNPSAEHKVAIEEAIAKLDNPFRLLISIFKIRTQALHINDLSPDLLNLLENATSVDVIQSPPDLLQPIQAVYEEVQLRKRILAFLASDSAEVTDEVEKDAKQAVATAADLGLTDQQVRPLKRLIST